MFSSKKEAPDFEYFTIFDAKVGVYREPVLALNKHDILRQIDSLFSNPDQTRNQLVTNAEDFQLFKVGEYSKRTGVITPCQPEHVANLHEIRFAAQNRQTGIVST